MPILSRNRRFLPFCGLRPNRFAKHDSPGIGLRTGIRANGLAKTPWNQRLLWGSLSKTRRLGQLRTATGLSGVRVKGPHDEQITVCRARCLEGQHEQVGSQACRRAGARRDPRRGSRTRRRTASTRSERSARSRSPSVALASDAIRVPASRSRSRRRRRCASKRSTSLKKAAGIE